MKIETKAVRDGLYDGSIVWVCHYNRPDMHKKALRNVPPTKCIVRPLSELPKNKRVYYSFSFFCPLKKGDAPTSKVISPVDNTGYRSMCGNELHVFDSKIECVESWNQQIANHAAVLDKLIENAADHWRTEKSILTATIVE